MIQPRISERSALALLFLSVSLLLIFTGTLLVDPGNNPLANIRPFDTLIDQCEVPGTSSIIRLYRRNVAAFDDYSWLVTYQDSSTNWERELILSYGSPAIETLACNPQ